MTPGRDSHGWVKEQMMYEAEKMEQMIYEIYETERSEQMTLSEEMRCINDGMGCNSLSKGEIQQKQSRNLENSMKHLEAQIKELCAIQQELFQRLEPILNKNVPIRGMEEETEKAPESSILNMTLLRFSKTLYHLENDTKNIISQLDI